jgi:hypothetical protein
MTNCNYSEHTKIQRKEIQKQIEELQEKLQKLEEIEKQPRMNLQQEGEYAVVSYHDKVYYRLEGATFLWYIKKGVSANHPVPTLVMVEDAETERLLEGLYYNHIQVKKEKEQRTKTPAEEAYKRVYGAYPMGEPFWIVFEKGYDASQEDYEVGEYQPTPQEPTKDKVSLYKRFEDEGAYGQIYFDDALKVVRCFLIDEAVIENEDHEYITFTLQKSLLEVPND